MFDIGTKIKRAWNTLWNYKMLWVFVLLLALTGAYSGGGGGGGGGTGYRFNNDQSRDFHMDGSRMPAWMGEIGTWFEQDVNPLFAPDRVVGTIIWTIVILFGISLLVGLLLALVRYPAETAVMRLVDEYEEDGTKKKFKQGWTLGWNKRAFRIWVIDLIIGAPAFVVFAGLAVGMAVFMVNMVNGDVVRQIPGMMGLILLAGFLFLVLAIVMIFVGLWRQFIVRAIAIDDAGIGEGFKRGWAMLAHNFKNAFLTWLVMLGMNIGVGIAMVFALLLLIPVMAVMTIPGALVAAIPGAITYGIASIFGSGPVVWIIAGFVAMIFFFTVVFLPASFLGGLYGLFSSSIWTQTYREMKRDPYQPPAMPVVPELPGK